MIDITFGSVHQFERLVYATLIRSLYTSFPMDMVHASVYFTLDCNGCNMYLLFASGSYHVMMYFFQFLRHHGEVTLLPCQMVPFICSHWI
jgi:hypothetical protein